MRDHHNSRHVVRNPFVISTTRRVVRNPFVISTTLVLVSVGEAPAMLPKIHTQKKNSTNLLTEAVDTR